MVSHDLPRHEKLTLRSDYEAAYRERRSAADDRLVVYVRPNGLEFSRIGRSVSGKWGNAVKRNRFRRRCHSAFRLNKHDLPKGYDIIVISRSGIDLSADEIAESLKNLMRKLCR